MTNRNESALRKRFHIVLIPGFGGFDALGKIEYYAGVTRIFQQWNTGKSAVLHYFDNLPTAAVVTRATRLQGYLAKRMARGEILEDDDIILVGHSTGGLDIRQLLSDLHDRQNPEVHVDGGIPVHSADIRRRVCRVVFLSVPHWGTNIADWVVSHACLRKTIVTELRAAIAGSQVYLLDQLENRIAGAAAFLTGADLLRAWQDALTEANERCGEPGPQRTADAHEAAAELALYFRDMASDFHVIEDLTSQPPDSEPKSPAHFNREQRKKGDRAVEPSAHRNLVLRHGGKQPVPLRSGLSRARLGPRKPMYLPRDLKGRPPQREYRCLLSSLLPRVRGRPLPAAR